MIEPKSDFDLQTESARKLYAAVSAERWQRLVEEAQRRCEIVEKVEAEVQSGKLYRHVICHIEGTTSMPVFHFEGTPP